MLARKKGWELCMRLVRLGQSELGRRFEGRSKLGCLHRSGIKEFRAIRALGRNTLPAQWGQFAEMHQ